MLNGRKGNDGKEDVETHEVSFFSASLILRTKVVLKKFLRRWGQRHGEILLSHKQ